MLFLDLHHIYTFTYYTLGRFPESIQGLNLLLLKGCTMTARIYIQEKNAGSIKIILSFFFLFISLSLALIHIRSKMGLDKEPGLIHLETTISETRKTVFTFNSTSLTCQLPSSLSNSWLYFQAIWTHTKTALNLNMVVSNRCEIFTALLVIEQRPAMKCNGIL